MTDVDLDDGLEDVVDEKRSRYRPGAAPRRPAYRRMRPTSPAAPENVYPHVAAWVAGFLSPTYARDWSKMDREYKWCSSWWLHVEAVVRLEAMWKAWEVLRLDPGTGASVWLLQHGDPGMAALTRPHGTFQRCGPDEHAAYDPLPVAAPPPGLFGP